MFPFRLPKCEQCNGNLASFVDVFKCMSCGLPHPHVQIPEEEVAMPPAESEPPLTNPEAKFVTPEMETPAHKPGRKKKQ